MSIKCTSSPYHCDNDIPKEFICDTVADVANLPKCCAGSTALVVEGGKIYMVNASGEWKLFGEA